MDEYISKAEAIEAIRQTYCPNCDSCNGIMCKACGYNDCMDIVDDVKAADVQSVEHGRWIWDSNAPHREHGAYKCSNCGCHSDFEENYCYNCGARMDLKDGDEE